MAACGMTRPQIDAAIKAAERVAAGIHPDDFSRFDSGEIAGYNPDGSYIPGPNAATFDDEDFEDDELDFDYGDDDGES